MAIRSPIQNDLMTKYVVLVVLGLIIYSNVLHGEFISDDHMWIVNNPFLIDQGFSGIWHSFNTRFMAGLTFALNYRLGGLDPFGYHLFNIFVHVINAILVYHFAVKAFQTPVLRNLFVQDHARRIAFYASLIFLSHPMQTEGVSYICQRFVSLATMFYLGTLICYLKARLEGKVRFYGVAFILMVMGLFTKEMTFTLPLNLIVCELLLLGSSWKTEWRRLLSLLLGGMLLVAIPLWIAHAMFEQRYLIGTHGVSISWDYILAESIVLCRYLQLFIFPWGQSFSYDYPMGEGHAGAAVIVSVVVLTGLIYYGARNFRKEPFVAYAIFWFFLTTSIEAVFAVLFAERHGSFMFDHWAYLSMVGFSFLAAMVIGRSNSKIFPSRYILVTIVLILSLLCYGRNKVWQSETGLWEDTIKKNPKTLVHYLALGVSYERKGLWQDAAFAFQTGIHKYELGGLTDFSLRIVRMYLSRMYNNSGVIAARYERNDVKAEDFFRRSLEIDRNNAEALNNLRLLAAVAFK